MVLLLDDAVYVAIVRVQRTRDKGLFEGPNECLAPELIDDVLFVGIEAKVSGRIQLGGELKRLVPSGRGSIG